MNPDQPTTSSSSFLSMTSALRALAQGIVGSDGSVTMTKEQVHTLVQEGKVSRQPDGSYRLNVSSPPFSSKTQQSSPASVRILQSDGLDTTKKTQTLSRPQTIDTAKEATLQTVNAEPRPPSIGAAQANPYLQSSSAARVRQALMTAYALQSEVAKLMREESAQFNKAIWQAANSQAKGIQMATQGKTLGLLASATAATATATGLVAQGTFTMMNKMRSVDMKQEAERIRSHMGGSSSEETKTRRNIERPSSSETSSSRRSSLQDAPQLEIEMTPEEKQKIDILLERHSSTSSSSSSKNSSAPSGSSSTDRVRVQRNQGPNLAALARAQALEREAERLDLGIEGMKIISGTQQNLSAAVRDGMKIIGTKQEETGRILELYSQTLQRVLERGVQQSHSQTKDAEDHAKQLLQIVVSQSQAQTSMSQSLWKI